MPARWALKQKSTFVDNASLSNGGESHQMVHAALLLLMLEAANTEFVQSPVLSVAPKISSFPQAGGRLPHLLRSGVAKLPPLSRRSHHRRRSSQNEIASGAKARPGFALCSASRARKEHKEHKE